MANLNLTPNELPQASTPLGQNDSIIVQQGIGGIVAKTTPTELVDSVSPVSTQGEAQAGIDNLNRMTSLRTKESIASEIGVSIASSAQGNLATTSVQPSRSLNTGTGLSGGGNLSSDRTLSLNPASIASLLKADTAVQPNITITAGTGLSGGGTLAANRTISLSSASIASLALADSSVQPTITISAGTGLTGGGTLASSRAIALNSTSIASLALADGAVQPSRLIIAGAGLSGGGTLAADRTVALNAASIASLAKADTAIQALGGSTGQILTKNSATNNDVSWQTVSSVTAVSYAPQTLTGPQQLQARQNIGSTTIGNSLFTAANNDVALAAIMAAPRPSPSGRGFFAGGQGSLGQPFSLPAGGSYAYWGVAYDVATGNLRSSFVSGIAAGGSIIAAGSAGASWTFTYWNLT